MPKAVGIDLGTTHTVVAWAELDGPLVFDTADVLARVEEHGDLFAVGEPADLP